MTILNNLNQKVSEIVNNIYYVRGTLFIILNFFKICEQFVSTKAEKVSIFSNKNCVKIAKIFYRGYNKYSRSSQKIMLV